MMRRKLNVVCALASGLGAWQMAGCGIGVQPLMPTPVIYTEGGFEPLAHIPEEERWTPRRVFYATNRARTTDQQKIEYGNTPSDDVAVGMALIGFGGPDTSWAALNDISKEASRDADLSLSIAGVMEVGRYRAGQSAEDAASPESAGFLLERLRSVIDESRDRDVLIYVHGAKVNFYNACVFAAQLDHFMGRDMTSIAFAWPTHQNIFSYALGSDESRAYDSADALATLIEMLAEETHAERIHVLSWSAGARVAMTALSELRRRHPEVDAGTLRERFRLGTVYFAAGDVPVHDFLERVEDIHSLADQLVVTQTDDDGALKASEKFIGGGRRIGQEAGPLSPDHLELVRGLDRLEVIDVSIGAEDRGFDITGHRYWFAHPWSSSDVLLSIRTRLGPAERGLEQGASPRLWSLPADYPERLQSLRLREGFSHRGEGAGTE